MMAEKRAIQPVSFNLTDTYESDLYTYALQQQKYFSRYVKRLIENDRHLKQHKYLPVNDTVRMEPPEPAKRKKEDVAAASSFL